MGEPPVLAVDARLRGRHVPGLASAPIIRRLAEGQLRRVWRRGHVLRRVHHTVRPARRLYRDEVLHHRAGTVRIWVAKEVGRGRCRGQFFFVKLAILYPSAVRSQASIEDAGDGQVLARIALGQRGNIEKGGIAKSPNVGCTHDAFCPGEI
ncbi:Protein kinase [Apiospora arundinis]